MIYRLIFTISICLCSVLLSGQQLPYRSPLGATNFVSNPAMTAMTQVLNFGGTYRREWLGFETAPTTMNIFGEYAFRNESMSVGGFLMNDETGIFQKTEAALTYRYGFRPSLFSRHDLLSFGVVGNIFNQRIKTQGVVGDAQDRLLFTEDLDAQGISFGGGFHYCSNQRMYDFRSNGLFISAAINQGFSLDSRFESNNIDYRNDWHGNASVGGRFVKSNSFFEPSIWLDYSNSQYLAAVNLIYELEETFWSGITYRTDSTIGIQVGAIVGGSVFGDGYLRIGAGGNYNISSVGSYRGFGVEVLVAYRFLTE